MTEETVEATEAPEVTETPPEPVQEQVQQRQWSDEDESEAKAFGWKSADEWKGEKPEGYIEDPRDYLNTRVRNSRIYKEMTSRADAAERAAQEVLRKQDAMNAKALERQKAQYEADMKRLRGDQRKAAEVGDLDAYDAAGKAMDALPKPEEPKQEAEPGPDPYLEQYAAQPEGAWMKDKFLVKQGYDIIEASGGAAGKTTQEQVAYVEGRLKLLYPHMFAAPKKEEKQIRTMVDGGGLAGGARKDAFSQLPAEAKSAFQRFVKEGLYKDNEAGRKEYADEYGAA